ncbi:MAG TPA: YraN family protein [Gemmatimonadaceae bacterium]|nr:YraN family protein [Gemmatimonadaceae bacterium]
MSATRRALGELGERVAARWLASKGWWIRALRYRNGHRDIDIVAQQRGTVIFVEVKARAGLEFGDPVQAVDWRKQRELRRSAQVWIARHGLPGEDYRFDVIGILKTGRAVKVKHVPNAFDAGDSIC